MKNESIGFIGTGNMATAIINGILLKEISVPKNISVFDVEQEKCQQLAEKLGVRQCDTIAQVIEECGVVFLSVKPQVYPVVLEEIRKYDCSGCVFVSIAAGISTQYINEVLNTRAKIVRVMPNTPLFLGEGATAMSYQAPVTEEEFTFVKSIFETSGIVKVLQEDKMNAVISVNGSSPAYVYLFAKSIIDGAVEQGIDAQTAKELIAQTLIGSAKMLTDSGDTPEELIKKVSSPGGTTLKALESLYAHNFEAAVKDAMLQCTLRAEELGK